MCQGLLPSRRHIEKREDPGDEVGQTGLRFSHIIACPKFTFGMFNSPHASHTNYVASSMQFQNVMYSPGYY